MNQSLGVCLLVCDLNKYIIVVVVVAVIRTDTFYFMLTKKRPNAAFWMKNYVWTYLNLKKQCLNNDVQWNNAPPPSYDRSCVKRKREQKKIENGNLKLMTVRFSTLRRKGVRKNSCKNTNQKQILNVTGTNNCPISCKKSMIVGFGKYDFD